MPPVIRYGPSLDTSITGSRSYWSTWSRTSLPSMPNDSAPDGQARAARTISSIRPPLGVTNGSLPEWKTAGTRSVQKPECAQIPRLSRMVICWPR